MILTSKEPNIFRILFSKIYSKDLWCCKPPVPLVGQKTRSIFDISNKIGYSNPMFEVRKQILRFTSFSPRSFKKEILWPSLLIPRTMDDQWSLFPLKFRTFGLGQTNWADKFWGIWGIFSQTISTHFSTVSPLIMFFRYSTIISTKKLSLLSPSQIFIWDGDLNLGCKDLGI